MPRLPRGVVTGKNSFTRTLKDLDNLSSSDWVRRQRFENFSLADLKKMKLDDLRYLYKKNRAIC